MTGRLFDVAEVQSLGIVNHVVATEDVVPKACEISKEFSGKTLAAWRRTKAQFFEIALVGFDEACRGGVLGQKEAYAEGEPQAAIDVFLIKKQ